jgi:SAM-dependent methyltransferase
VVWESGDFGLIARHNEPSAAEFMERLSLREGERLLDLACGTGNLAVLAARAGCVTTGLDIAANLIAQARVRAQAAGLAIEFLEGDAESMPFPTASFDCVVSMFGMMFAPRPERAARECCRICRPGGTVALANWTPESVIGESLRLVAQFVPPAPGTLSPLLWGDETMARGRLEKYASQLRLTRRVARLRYPFPPAQTVDFFRQFYGPILRAFAALSPDGQARLHQEFESLFCRHNCSRDGTTEVEAEYLEVVATRSE